VKKTMEVTMLIFECLLEMTLVIKKQDEIVKNYILQLNAN
jgi:hypothetical protein